MVENIWPNSLMNMLTVFLFQHVRGLTQRSTIQGTAEYNGKAISTISNTLVNNLVFLDPVQYLLNETARRHRLSPVHWRAVGSQCITKRCLSQGVI